MCMGLGCNAVGVTGCRIIDSKRERLIAILTNAFMPCNGKFPTLIALISMFLVSSSGFGERAVGAAILALLLMVSIFATLLFSWGLSKTLLRGEASSFSLELPPYRTPEVGRVILRSICDRTVFVLGRAVAVAAPTGLILWILANLRVGDASVLQAAASCFDPIGRFFGMDGVILLAFLLAIPANEIVIPVMLMAYTSGTSLMEYASLGELKGIFLENGWGMMTALCVLIFMLFHFPCSTTLMTVKKETGKTRFAVLAALLPTAFGAILCLMVVFFFKILA